MQAGIKELTWLIGGIPSIMAEKNQLPFDIWVKTTPSMTIKLKRSSMSSLSNTDEEYTYEKTFYDTNYDEDGTGGSKARRDNNRFALRKRTDEEDSFEITEVFLLPKQLLIMKVAIQKMKTDGNPGKKMKFVGTVRSAPATVRPAFIEAFRDTRLDVYPLSSNTRNALAGHTTIDNTGGTRIDCQAPRHYPKSHSFPGCTAALLNNLCKFLSEFLFLWTAHSIFLTICQKMKIVYVEISVVNLRITALTLVGNSSYNFRDDISSLLQTKNTAWAPAYCIGALPMRKQPYQLPKVVNMDLFRLVLPQYAGLKQHSFSDMGSHQHPHYQPNRVAMSKPSQFPPRIDEYQPNVFPEPAQSPAPMYKWSRVDGLKFSKRHRVINYGRVLRIDSVRLEDAVRYKCTAKNNIGTASAEIQLIVQAPTIVLRPMIDQLAAVNETVVFHCLVNDAINGLSRSNGNTNTVTSSSVEWFPRWTAIGAFC
uniref:Immunoglobulin I-set domain-containing protein n=1 Tax=Ditylenchus dipsaci TaxID=166011 RepID=A0A915D1T8_9BILA